MDVMQVSVEGVERFQRKMEQVARDIHGPPVLNAMRDCTLKVQRDAKINAPIDTGRLRASIMPEVRTHTKTIEGVVGTNVVYAPAQELGSKPHIIEPKNARVLSFFWERGPEGPKQYFFARVRHPGTRAKRFMQRALEHNQQYIKSKWEGIVGRIVTK